MRIVWTTPANADFARQIAYIDQRSPRAAARMGARILAAVSSLEVFPNLGRAGEREGTRELIVSGTPFIVTYRVIEGTVELLHLWHSSQDWKGRD